MPVRYRCGDCGAELVSRHRHDFRLCPCGKGNHIDGGAAPYVRTGGNVEFVNHWDWETADGRELKAEDIEDAHLASIFHDFAARDLPHVVIEEGCKRFMRQHLDKDKCGMGYYERAGREREEE